MWIRFLCPDCKTTLTISSDKSGTEMICPTCKMPVIVPAPAKKAKLGIFIEEYEETGKPSAPLPAVDYRPPSIAPSLPLPTEKDWRTEPPLPLAEELPPDDDLAEEDNEGANEHRPRQPRRARAVPNVSLLPSTILVVFEAIFGGVALAIAVAAFLRVQH